MKKTVLIALCALFTFVACQKTPSAPQTENTEIKEIVFKIAVNHSDDTKAVKTGWTDGDKVYVFFQGVTGVKYVTLTRSGSDWGATLTGITASELATAAPTNMYAVFFPYEQPVIASDGGSGVTFKTGGHSDAAIDGLSIYSYYMTATSTCTVTDNGVGTATITGTLNMAIPAGYVQFFINKSSDDYNEDYRYRLSVDGVKPTACVSYSAGTFGTKELKAAQPMWGYKHGTDGIAFSGVIDGTWASAADHIIYLFDINAAAKSFTISDKTLASHNTVNFVSNHPSVSGWSAAVTAPTTIEAIGIKWGAWNLGATAAGTVTANYGWYFVWGDIVPATGTAASSAPASGFGGSSYHEKTVAYEALSRKTVNLTGDYAIYDMVTAFLGPNWRMPTKDEYVALCASYSWGDNNSLNANSVVLFPAAGFWRDGIFYSGGNLGCYWSSSRYDSDNYNAYYLYFYGGSDVYPAYNVNRYFGLSVRPVYIGE